MTARSSVRVRKTAEQGRGFLEGQVAWQSDDRFFVKDRKLRQHPIEIGAEPVGQVVSDQRSAKPARMEGADDPVAELDPRYPVANGRDLARAVGKRHDAELCRTTTARRLSGPSDRGS